MEEVSNTKRNGVFLLCILPSWALNIWPMVDAAFQDGHLDSELGANVILLTVSVACMSIIPLAIVKAWRHHWTAGLLIAPFVLLFGGALFSVNWHNAINVASHVQDKLTAGAENAQKRKAMLDANIEKWQIEAGKIPANHTRENEDTLKAAEDAAKAATATREAECKYLGSRCHQAEDAQRTAFTHRTNVATAFQRTKDEERLDKLIRGAKEELSTLAVPKKADPAAAKFASILGFIGFDETMVHDNWPVWLTFVAEMIAMCGPAIWILMLSKPAVAREAAPIAAPAPAAKPDTAVEDIAPPMEPEAANVAEDAASKAQEPAPLPPSPRRRMKPRKAKVTKVANIGPSVVVLPFRKAAPEDVKALMASGKTQKEIAAELGCSERTIRNILNRQNAPESAVSFPA